MPRTKLTFALAAAVGVILVAATVRPPDRSKRRASEFRPLLLRPTVARTISRSFLPMLVDLYWLRSLNAIGMADSAEKNRNLYEYGEVLSDLDPRFYQPYTFIGLAVPYPVGRDEYVNADLASKLMRKGLQQYPNDMKLHLYLGFNLFQYEKKLTEAAEVFAHAGTLPDALPFTGLLATRLLATGGNVEEALKVARELAETATDEGTREELEKRARDLEVEVALQTVERATKRFYERHQYWPVTLFDLRREGLYDGPDQDPLGGQLSLTGDGKATSTSLQYRIQVFRDDPDYPDD
jgi:tetratricopeptide (TPR) repeat protein